MESVYPFERMHVISQQAHNVEIWLNIGLVITNACLSMKN